MRYKSILHLSAGDVVSIPVCDSKGRVLINQNIELSDYYIKRLSDADIKGVYVYDDLSDGINSHSNLSMQMQFKAAAASNKVNIDECTYLASSISKELQNENCIVTNMISLMGYDVATYLHSVNVSTYAGIMGIALGYPMERIKKVIMTGLVHDIGKTLIPKEIIDSPNKLSKEQYDIIKRHPRMGYDMLKNSESVPSVVRVSVLQHHENSDGSGYPGGIRDMEIYEFAQIIHICDVYDAMISRRSYKNAINPADVIEHIMANSGKMFNPELVKVFLKILMPYPEGVIVQLSDDNYAIVKENNKDFPTRPVVRLMNGTDINLTDKLNLTIKNIAV